MGVATDCPTRGWREAVVGVGHGGDGGAAGLVDEGLPSVGVFTDDDDDDSDDDSEYDDPGNHPSNYRPPRTKSSYYQALLRRKMSIKTGPQKLEQTGKNFKINIAYK